VYPGREGIEKRIVDRVNGLRADMVAITGDLVDGSVAQLSAHTAPLANLKSRHGTYVVTGNHEYYSGAQSWIGELERLGAYVLLNEHVVIDHDGAPITIAGVLPDEALPASIGSTLVGHEKQGRRTRLSPTSHGPSSRLSRLWPIPRLRRAPSWWDGSQYPSLRSLGSRVADCCPHSPGLVGWQDPDRPPHRFPARSLRGVPRPLPRRACSLIGARLATSVEEQRGWPEIVSGALAGLTFARRHSLTYATQFTPYVLSELWTAPSSGGARMVVATGDIEGPLPTLRPIPVRARRGPRTNLLLLPAAVV
jgi:hypothetical protein